MKKTLRVKWHKTRLHEIYYLLRYEGYIAKDFLCRIEEKDSRFHLTFAYNNVKIVAEGLDQAVILALIELERHYEI